jgi:hypothetical protein
MCVRYVVLRVAFCVWVPFCLLSLTADMQELHAWTEPYVCEIRSVSVHHDHFFATLRVVTYNPSLMPLTTIITLHASHVISRAQYVALQGAYKAGFASLQSTYDKAHNNCT